MEALAAQPGRYSGVDREGLARLAAKKGADARYNDLTAGNTTWWSRTGPSYATQRQEAAQSLERLVAAFPQVMAIAGDLIYKFQDFLGAEEIAERIERTMPPNLVPPKEGAPQRPPQPPPPQLQVKMMEMEVRDRNYRSSSRSYRWRS